MYQYRGEPISWETDELGSVSIIIKDRNGELSHRRNATEEELTFIKIIVVMRKIIGPKYVLRHKRNCSLKEVFPKPSLSESV